MHCTDELPLFIFPVIIFICEYSMTLEGLYYALKSGITKEKFAFIAIEESPISLELRLSNPTAWFASEALSRNNTDFIPAVQKIFDSVLVFASQRQLAGDRTKYDYFSKEVRRRMSEPLFNSTAYLVRDISVVSHDKICTF